VVGLKDVVPDDSASKGASEETDYINIQKTLWRPSIIKYEGGISFPVTTTDNNVSNLPVIFDLAKYANTFDIKLIYNCLIARTFKNCKINTLSFNITAGDIVNITAQIVAMDVEDVNSGDPFTTAQKLVTWDKVDLDGGESIDLTEAQSFSFEINNNINTIYTHNSLKPKELRVGMQSVNGSISLYNKHGIIILPDEASSIVINLTVLDLNTVINCILKPSVINGDISSIFSTIQFVGVDRVFEG